MKLSKYKKITQREAFEILEEVCIGFSEQMRRHYFEDIIKKKGFSHNGICYRIIGPRGNFSKLRPRIRYEQLSL